MNVWTIVTTSSGMFHLRNLTAGVTSSIGHRIRETAERNLSRMVTDYPQTHQAAPGAITRGGGMDSEIITSDPDCRWCSRVDGSPSDCTCTADGCGYPNCNPLVSWPVEPIPPHDGSDLAAAMMRAARRT